MPWNNGYDWRRTLTIDHTQVPSGLTNFPVLVAGTFAYLATLANSGLLKNASGFDVIFTSDAAGANLVPFETVGWNAATGAVEYWVQVPSVSSSVDTLFYMFYGNSGTTTDQSNKTGTWDANYVAVYHFKDGTTLDLTDSTSNANNGTNHSGTATAGEIDGGLHLTAASSQYIDLGAGASIEINGSSKAFSIEAWAFFDSSPAVADMILSNLNVANTGGYELFTTQTGTIKLRLQIGTGGATSSVDHPTAVTNSVWHHCAGAYGSSNGVVYLDGTSANATFNNTIGSSASNVNIGRRPGSGLFFHDGKLDELRISNVKRANEWIVAGFNNQKPSSTFLAVGAQTEQMLPYVETPLTGPILAQ